MKLAVLFHAALALRPHFRWYQVYKGENTHDVKFLQKMRAWEQKERSKLMDSSRHLYWYYQAFDLEDFSKALTVYDRLTPLVQKS